MRPEWVGYIQPIQVIVSQMGCPQRKTLQNTVAGKVVLHQSYEGSQHSSVVQPRVKPISDPLFILQSNSYVKMYISLTAEYNHLYKPP